MGSRILVVDESPEAGRELADALELDGYQVQHVQTAAAGLALIGELKPDLVLLACVLPDANGIDLLVQLKQDAPSREVAVIVTAESLQDQNVIAALELGATDFIPRPFSAAVVRARVRNALRVRNLQLRMRRQKENAELATMRKTAFLSNMSHEIRTPMTAILGFTDLLYFEGDIDRAPPHRVEAIRTIKRNAQYLLGLINDILDLSKVEAGKLEVTPHRCSAVRVVEEAIALLRMKAEEKGLELTVRFDGPVPQSVHTDPARLRQILINLINNAVKFTESGAVDVKVSMDRGQEDDPDDPRLRFDIRDTGVGISEEQQNCLFQPFTQASPHTSHRYGGTGLGLSISKQLVGLLGGDLSVQSEAGCGSVFTFTIATGSLEGVRLLDCVAGAHAEGEDDLFSKPLRKDMDGVRVLLAEDGPDNQRLISSVLNKAGAEVVIADNGEVAVRLAQGAFEEQRPFDVVLMDMQMPVLDGVAATKQLRDEGYLHPIVALTAHAARSDRQRCLDAGCDAYAAKPIDRHKLVNLVHRYRSGEARLTDEFDPVLQTN